MPKGTIERADAAPDAQRSNRVLVIDEEAPLTHLLTLALSFEGWEVETLDRGEGAVAAATRFAPDAILLDMMLPDRSGVDVVADLRAGGITAPVIFLTGRTALEDRIAAFAAGGDDYMTKPFGLEEVTERLRGVFRRIGRAPSSRVFADVVLDTRSSQVWRAGEAVLLSPLEVRMLEILIDRDGEPVDGAGIVAALGLHGHTVVDSAAMRALASLRSKLDGDGDGDGAADTLIVVSGGSAWLRRPGLATPRIVAADPAPTR
jgi:two-component system OmpR family response regulator